MKFHSEMGSPNVVEMETLRRTMPESAMWPQGYQWPLHDYFIRSMFPEFHFPPSEIDAEYGGATNICRLARASRSSSTTTLIAACMRGRARTASACSSG